MQTNTVPEPRSIVIQTLSKRLYSSLASAMREPVSNSADADATELHISLYRSLGPDGDEYHLTFTDDGEGIGFNALEQENSDFANYLTIGGVSRRERDSRDQTERGRPLIGLMGVGSLAVAPWCRQLVVLTKKRGETQALHAVVDYEKFFKDRSVQRRSITDEYQFSWELLDTPPEEMEKSWTTLDMVGLRSDIAQELASTANTTDLGLMRDGYSRLTGATRANSKKTFSDHSGLIKFMHDLVITDPNCVSKWCPYK